MKTKTAETAKNRKRGGNTVAKGFGGGVPAECAKWREGYNPTKRLTVERAVWLMECYSRGMFAELMWLFGAPYMGIEKKDPVYLAIIERRVAAVRQMDWSVRVDAADAQDARAAAQKKALEDAYGKIRNLGKAIEALEMATFRGFAHLGITPEELVVVQPWNVQRDGCTGGWRFNPGAQDCGWEALGPEMDMEPALHVTREVERPVGAVALVKWLRGNLSEKDWDAFIEVYGLPAWLIVGPPNIPTDKVDAYQLAAEKIARGGSGYLPNGSSAQCADSPRAGAPFGERLKYLNEMLVIAGTGGMLTMLAEAGSGTLAGNAHADAFATLAKMDAADISECFQRQFDRRVLEGAGLLRPGERPKAWFTLDYKSEPDVGETVQQIQGLSSAGYEVDPAQVEELTGYRVTRKETPAQPGGFVHPGLFSRKQPGTVAARGTAGETPAFRQETGPRTRRISTETRFARALQQDLRPAAKTIAEALKTRDWRRAKQQMDGMLKQCGTESAQVLEGAMRFAGVEWMPVDGAVEEKVETVKASGTSEGAKKGWETRKKNGWTSKEVEEKKKVVHDLAAEALSNPDSHDEKTLGTVNETVAKDIEAVHPGLNAEGYVVSIASNDIRHARNEHGPREQHGRRWRGERRKDQIPLSQEDYDRIPEVLSDYDRIEAGSPEEKTGFPSVRYFKDYADGTEVVVEVIATDDKKLRYKTGWKLEPKKSAGSMERVQASPITSETIEPTKDKLTTLHMKGKEKP